MILGFIVWSVVAIIFWGIGISCRKSHEAVGFFTFDQPPIVKKPLTFFDCFSGWAVYILILKQVSNSSFL